MDIFNEKVNDSINRQMSEKSIGLETGKKAVELDGIKRELDDKAHSKT